MAGDQVDEVKQKTDIVSVVSEHLDLKKAGRNYKALCPFHSEKTPSFTVSPELQIFKCFGCNSSGDVFTFLQEYEGMDFPEALRMLAKRAGIRLKPAVFKDSEGKQRLYEINNLAKKFYQYILLKHPAGRTALGYLVKERGIKPATIKTFQLGYSPERSDAIVKFLVEKKGYSKKDLDRAGLIYSRDGRVQDRFYGRVVFPLFDHRGNVVGFAGRLMPGKESGYLAKYINTAETLIYHKARMLYGLNTTRTDIKKKKQAVVVEGELDAISAWQTGIKNVVAIKGSALTQEQGRLLSRFAERIVLAMDTDLAGDAAARRGISVAEDAGLGVRVAKLGKYKDPDEMVQKNPKRFVSAVEEAVGVWDFIVDSIFSQHSKDTGTGMAKISREIIPVLASISDKIVQAHYVEMVAKRLSVPVSAVTVQVEGLKDRRQKQKKAVEEIARPQVKQRRELLEERLLSIAFSLDPKILLDKKITPLIKTPLARRIFEEYKNYSKKEKDFDPSDFTQNLPNELVEGFADIIIKEVPSLERGSVSKQKELEIIKRELKILSVKVKLGQLAEEIRIYEKKKQKNKLRQAEKKFSRLSENLTNIEDTDFGGIIL